MSSFQAIITKLINYSLGSYGMCDNTKLNIVRAFTGKLDEIPNEKEERQIFFEFFNCFVLFSRLMCSVLNCYNDTTFLVLVEYLGNMLNLTSEIHSHIKTLQTLGYFENVNVLYFDFDWQSTNQIIRNIKKSVVEIQKNDNRNIKEELIANMKCITYSEKISKSFQKI